ncbi:MAG: hypothetical protein HC939_05655 [Pleurocapsa sp. SU_5_0]|nr:hypothetical protein [Pleurocapsa sp. SU_5_0]NJR46095.1 hypothetical protein [Hyellaceae cyanobacterium CSU_1_1]
MKNIKVLGLAIVASIIAAPAFAGETYVRNESINSWGDTHTNLGIESNTYSTRNEAYGSFAYKEYTDGDVTKQGGYWGKPLTVSYDDYSEHTAGSLLVGKFTETIHTKVGGHINSYSEFKSNAHETSAGVR